jgi:SAM-dependent methyltransferase
LRHFGQGSVGLELDPTAIAIGRNEGLDIRPWSFENDIPPELENLFDVVWASNLFEHVLAPHEFLIDLRRAIAPGGCLIIVAPVVRRPAIGPFRGFLAADHVNFFTPATLKLTIERAGYRVETVASASFPQLPMRTAEVLGHIAPSLFVKARPIPGFDYPEKALKRLVGHRIEFKGTLGDP